MLLNSGARGGDTLVLAILDLDDFKTLNNIHGHAAGDTVLHVLGKRALAMLRPEDVFGRIGGDEFAFLVATRSAEEGERFARILHARLSRALETTQHPVTCSMGVLLVPPRSFRSAAELLDVADQAMYRVKRSGKDGLQIAHVDAARNYPSAPA
ncbi:hypothetical protein GCM10017612_29140 [Novosphingobium resinovorum]|nr:hypothetical protein GCM10017612_29140 [Novosphingobium resinovorum]